KPRGDFVVLASPSDAGLIESVHTQQIAFPIRLIAAADRALARSFPEKEPAQKKAAQSVAPPTDTARKETQLQAPLPHHAVGNLRARQEPYALNERGVAGGPQMVRDEVLVQHHVTVHDDQIVASRGDNRTVAGSSETETAMGL